MFHFPRSENQSVCTDQCPPPCRSAGDRGAASSPCRAQTEGSGRSSVSVGGAARLSDPPHDLVLLVALLLPGHVLQPGAKPQLHRRASSGSPLHPAPPAPVSRRAALRHPEPGELRQRGHQRVDREQLGLLTRQHVQVNTLSWPEHFGHRKANIGHLFIHLLNSVEPLSELSTRQRL